MAVPVTVVKVVVSAVVLALVLLLATVDVTVLEVQAVLVFVAVPCGVLSVLRPRLVVVAVLRVYVRVEVPVTEM